MPSTMLNTLQPAAVVSALRSGMEFPKVES
jgi:hypothetical protein